MRRNGDLIPSHARQSMLKTSLYCALLALLGACAVQKPRPTPDTRRRCLRRHGADAVIDHGQRLRAEDRRGDQCVPSAEWAEPLKPKVQLIVVAQNHARNMARQDKFGDSDQNGHILDGHNFEYRIEASGYASNAPRRTLAISACMAIRWPQ